MNTSTSVVPTVTTVIDTKTDPIVLTHPIGFEIKNAAGSTVTPKEVSVSLQKEIDESRYVYNVEVLSEDGNSIKLDGVGGREMVNVLNRCFEENATYTFVSVVAIWINMNLTAVTAVETKAPDENTPHGFFLSVFNNRKATPIEYKESWDNGMGYLNNFIHDKELVMEEGEMVIFTTLSRRKAIGVQTMFGRVVIFERYTDAECGVLVKNTSRGINALDLFDGGAVTLAELKNVFGPYGHSCNIGLRFKLASKMAK